MYWKVTCLNVSLLTIQLRSKYLCCMMRITTLHTQLYLTLDTQVHRSLYVVSKFTDSAIPFLLGAGHHVLEARDEETVREPLHTILRNVNLPP